MIECILERNLKNLKHLLKKMKRFEVSEILTSVSGYKLDTETHKEYPTNGNWLNHAQDKLELWGNLYNK
jgi:hypothetical protein